MVQAKEIEKILASFEENTNGILGSSIIYTPYALVIAEASTTFDTEVVQAISEKMLSLAQGVWKEFLPDFTPADLKSVIIDEQNHSIFVQPVTSEYHITVITSTEETRGLILHNIKGVIQKIIPLLDD